MITPTLLALGTETGPTVEALLQNAILNSANFSIIATDEKGVIQLFNIGAETMLGYAAVEVVNKITPADIHDPQEVIERAQALSRELATTIAPGFEGLALRADLHPEGREPFSRDRVGHRAARRGRRHHRISADRDR